MDAGGILVDLGAGHARVGGVVLRIAPAAGGPAGALAVGDVVLRPLRFGERLRLVADALESRPDDAAALAAAILAAARMGGAAPRRTERAAVEALALHLAGARNAGAPAPGFASAVGLVARAYGWSAAEVADVEADLVDRLARDVERSADGAGDEDGDGWTRIVLTGTDAHGAEAAHEPGPGAADAVAVRDHLARDLLRRGREPFSPTVAAAGRRPARAGPDLGDPVRAAPVVGASVVAASVVDAPVVDGPVVDGPASGGTALRSAAFEAAGVRHQTARSQRDPVDGAADESSPAAARATPTAAGTRAAATRDDVPAEPERDQPAPASAARLAALSPGQASGPATPRAPGQRAAGPDGPLAAPAWPEPIAAGVGWSPGGSAPALLAAPRAAAGPRPESAEPAHPARRASTAPAPAALAAAAPLLAAPRDDAAEHVATLADRLAVLLDDEADLRGIRP